MYPSFDGGLESECEKSRVWPNYRSLLEFIPNPRVGSFGPEVRQRALGVKFARRYRK